MSVTSPFDPHPPSAYSLLAEETVNGRRLEVVQLAHFRLLRWGGNAIQSAMNLDDPDRVINPVTATMLGSLRWGADCHDALNLGVGGGTIERFLARHYQEIRLASVEENESVIRLAESFFGLDTATVTVDSAENYLARRSGRFDVIFCDLFVGESPAECLASPAFLAQLSDALVPDGTAVFNLLATNAEQLLATLAGLRDHLPWTRLCTIGTHGNVIVFSRHMAPTHSDAELEHLLESFLREANVAAPESDVRLRSVPDRLR